MKIFYKALCLSLVVFGLLHCNGLAKAADMSFDSFEAAEAAAKKRAEEYQKKMQEHLKNVNEQWEKQQKDLGSDSSSPDIGKITTRQDGQQSSETEEGKKLEDAVTSSVNKLKDEMMNKASPSSTGFAGGAAGYQWSVKFKNGKYVLSDSYNEAEFSTGKKTTPPTTPAASGEADKITAKEPTTSPPAKTAQTSPAPPEGTIATKPPVEPTNTVQSNPADSTPSEPTATPSPSKPSSQPAAPVSEPVPPPAQGVDPAPIKLPPPSVKLVIQHPTDFTEEVFAGNAGSDSTANFRLDKFKIPEDTRIKIAVEVGDDVTPEEVSLIVTDDQGDSQPVSAARLKNYRHMFRVPSEDKYSASVYVADKSAPGNQQKKILQVIIPVGKVDFESRTIDNQRGSGSGRNPSSSAGTSSRSDSSVSHSSFGQPQQVDLSDLYATPGANTTAAGGVSQNNSGSNHNDTANKQSDSFSQTNPPNYVNSSAGSYNEEPGHSGIAADTSVAAGIKEDHSDESNTKKQNYDDATADSTPDYADRSTDSSSSAYSQNSDASGDDSSESDTGVAGHKDSDQPGSHENDHDGYEAASGSYDASTGNELDPETESLNSAAAGSAQHPENTAATSNEGSDDFLMAVSLRCEAQKLYQSFNFLDGHSQKSSAIKAGSEVIFSLDMAAGVDPASIMIRLSDGNNEIKGNLKRMGESFAYTFQNPTPAAYIEVSGKSGTRSFNYRVAMPVE